MEVQLPEHEERSYKAPYLRAQPVSLDFKKSVFEKLQVRRPSGLTSSLRRTRGQSRTMSGYGRMPKLAAAVVATHAVPSSLVTGGSALYHWPGVLPVPACCRFAPIGMLGFSRAPLANRSAEPAEPKEVRTLRH